MKLRNRIFAILLTLALMLSVMPMVFAAEQVTVTLVTPSGTTTETMEAGGTFTFPVAEDYDGYWYYCWVTRTYEKTDGSDVDEFYFENDSITITEDCTFYALYLYEAGDLAKPIFYWTGNMDDYSGEYAIVGFNPNEAWDDFDYNAPIAFDKDGNAVDVAKELGASVIDDYDQFCSAAKSIVYTFAIQNDGTYTIRNLESGKYLGLNGFVSAPDAYCYWNIVLDDGYETIVNAKNSNMILLYDYLEEEFSVMDNSVYYGDGLLPGELFFVALYARETKDYLFTTQVPGVEPEPPIELPDHDCPSVKYTDLNLKAWYHDGVDFVLNNGYMNGVSSDIFRPDGTLNRAMVATVLYRIAGEPAVEGTSNFSDVEAGTWYTNAVIWAQANGIVTGYTDNTFKPTKEITRQEMAVMLARYAKLLGMEITGGDLSTYPDAKDVPSWAEESMAWCVAKGLINGVQSGGVSSLKPGNNATRAQFATIIMRYLTMG